MDDLNALPYLDCVIRETLRLYTPVTSTARMASVDTVIPVEKPYVDKYGKVRNEIVLKKGDQITIPIRTVARSTEIWGQDAHEFKFVHSSCEPARWVYILTMVSYFTRPERWEKEVPSRAKEIPTVFSDLPTFIAGPRACIGTFA